MPGFEDKVALGRAKKLMDLAQWRQQAESPDDWERRGLTLLMTAVLDFPHESELIADILSHTTNLEQREATTGSTALHFAAQGNAYACATALLTAGADPNALDNNGNSPLKRALTKRPFDMDLIAVLLEHGADPDIPNNTGVSALERLEKTAPDSKRDKVLDMIRSI